MLWIRLANDLPAVQAGLWAGSHPYRNHNLDKMADERPSDALQPHSKRRAGGQMTKDDLDDDDDGEVSIFNVFLMMESWLLLPCGADLIQLRAPEDSQSLTAFALCMVVLVSLFRFKTPGPGSQSRTRPSRPAGRCTFVVEGNQQRHQLLLLQQRAIRSRASAWRPQVEQQQPQPPIRLQASI